MTPQHNIPLMRRILAQITANPDDYDQADFTRDVAGWAVRLSGADLAHLHPEPGWEAVEIIDYRTGCVSDIADVVTELLGTTIDETLHLMYIGRGEAIDWLVDAIKVYESRVIARMEVDFAEVDQ